MKPKTKEEIKKMTAGGKILAVILKSLAKEVKPGIKTIDLENKARELIGKYGVKPSFLGFGDYPAVLCVSVNEQIVHAVPSQRILNEGDIVSLDLGIWHHGLAVDAAITVGAGRISENSQKLIKVTEIALKKGLKAIKSGITTGDLGFAIQSYVESENLNVVRELVGHGVGYDVHEPPQLPNYGKPGVGSELKENLVLAIEPMVTFGSGRIIQGQDGFAYETADKEPAAHFEATVAVTKKGISVLTPIFD